MCLDLFMNGEYELKCRNRVVLCRVLLKILVILVSLLNMGFF